MVKELKSLWLYQHISELYVLRPSLCSFTEARQGGQGWHQQQDGEAEGQEGGGTNVQESPPGKAQEHHEGKGGQEEQPPHDQSQ